jgi:hypothetical protein
VRKIVKQLLRASVAVRGAGWRFLCAIAWMVIDNVCDPCPQIIMLRYLSRGFQAGEGSKNMVTPSMASGICRNII